MITLLQASFLPGLAFFALSVQTQDLSRKVTYATVAVPAKRAVNEIAKLTGVKLDVAAPVAGEVLVISVKDVSLSDLMARIATVTSSEWKQDPEGTHWLNRSASAQRREEREEQQRRTAQVTEALKKLADSLKPKPEKPEEEKKPEKGEPPQGPAPEEIQQAMEMGFSGVGAGTPAGKAIARLSSLLSPQTLAAIERDGRVVFSTSPATPMQRPLGTNIGPIIADLIVEHNAAAEKEEEAKKRKEQEEEQNPKSEEQKRREEFAKMFINIFGFGLVDKRITAPPAKVLLIAARGGLIPGIGMFGLDTISLELKVYDERGTVVLTGSQPMQLREIPDFAGAFSGTSKPAPVGKPIEFSALTKEFASFSNFNPMAGGVMEKKLSAELLERVARPDLYDPLSFTHSEAMLAVAKEKGWNVVANIPDSVVSVLDTFAAQSKHTVESFLSGLQSGKQTSAEAKDGWLTVRPARPAESRLMRVDREALAQLIAAARSKELPSLDDYAAFALRSEPPMETPVSFPYLLFFAPNTMQQGVQGITDWNMLRLYGQLTSAQRQGLVLGAKLEFRILLPSQKELVKKMAFGSSARLRVEGVDEEPLDEGGFFEMIREFLPRRSTNYRDEPTEVMPNGLPAGGHLELKLTPDTFAMAIGPSGETNRMFGALGPDELAMLRYFKEDAAFGEMSEMMPRIDRVRLGTRRAFDFTFHVATGVSFKRSLLDDSIAKGSQPISIENLPKEFQAKIEKRLQALKKSPLPFGPGQPPPPPPS